MEQEKFELSIWGILRIIFVVLNNLYCIPVHFLWILCLQPLRYISESFYWEIEGIFFRWILSMVAFWSYSANYNIREIGDDVTDIIEEETLVLFNHQSTSDVPLIMAAFNSRRTLHNNILWIMDRVFKLTNFGLVSVLHGDFFIRGGKEHRDSSLKALASYLHEFYIPRGRKWLVLFPEGGFLKNRKPISQRYAQKNNYPHLENVSLPRVGAMKVILDTVAAERHDEPSQRIKYVLDVTVAYPGGNPLDLLTIVSGWRTPCDIIFHYRKFYIEEVPTAEDVLTSWVYNRYFEKESVLQEYYDTGVFPEFETPHVGEFKYITSKKSKGIPVSHDPMEFILRHLFYILSTLMWISLLYWALNTAISL